MSNRILFVLNSMEIPEALQCGIMFVLAKKCIDSSSTTLHKHKLTKIIAIGRLCYSVNLLVFSDFTFLCIQYSKL